MTKRNAFRPAISRRPAHLLGAALLFATATTALAETASGPQDIATLQQTAAAQSADADPEATRSQGGGPRTPLQRPAAKPSVAPAKALPEDDYYSRRAKSRLVEDQADAAKQLSLQAAYPGHNVVMCEAGCYGGASRIVQFTPRVATNAETASTLTPSSVSLTASAAPDTTGTRADTGTGTAQPDQPVAAAADDITCVAGCYGTAASYRSASHAAAQAAAHAEIKAMMQSGSTTANRSTPPRPGATGAEASRWMTTSVKADAKPQSDQDRAAATAAANGPAKQKKRTAAAKPPRIRSNPSGEWFQQINSDRYSRVR